MLRIRRPCDHRHGRALGLGRVGIADVVAIAVTVVPDAVEGQLVLDQGAVLFVLGRLLHVLLVHPPEVVVLGVDAGEAVGGDTGPGRVLALLGLVFLQFLGRDVVLEMVDLLDGLLGLRILLEGRSVRDIQRAAHVETEDLVILEFKTCQRQMLRIEGVMDNGGHLHGKLLHVERLGLGASNWIHYVIVGAGRGLVAVPELVTVLEPVGRNGRGEDHACDGLLREPRGGLVVRGFLRESIGAHEERQCK